jgi:hypothetical protein
MGSPKRKTKIKKKQETEKMKTMLELADAIHLLGFELLAKTKLTPLQLTALRKIANCRTAALGGHEQVCENCGIG